MDHPLLEAYTTEESRSVAIALSPVLLAGMVEMASTVVPVSAGSGTRDGEGWGRG
jgi:hypothetical protein